MQDVVVTKKNQLQSRVGHRFAKNAFEITKITLHCIETGVATVCGQMMFSAIDGAKIEGHY